MSLKCPDQANAWRQKVSERRAAWAGLGDWGPMASERGVSFWGVENPLNRGCSGGCTLRDYTKNQTTLYFEQGNLVCLKFVSIKL